MCFNDGVKIKKIYFELSQYYHIIYLVTKGLTAATVRFL